jgi:hypothetical protein
MFIKKKNYILFILFILILIILYRNYNLNKKYIELFNIESNTYIFYHIYSSHKTYPIVNDQINKIIFSGLYNKVNKIYVFITGEDEHVEKIKNLIERSGKKFSVEDIGINDKTYERFTLLKIKKYINENDKFLYIHSKGVTNDNPNIVDWRNLMEYFLIYKYNDCIQMLEDYDTIGINYIDNLHYSGNFWWTKGSYFMKLPNEIGDDYTSPEDYICKSNPKIGILYSSGLQLKDEDGKIGYGHYKNEYPYSKYIDHQ